VNVVSSPNRVIPHPLIERSGNHPTGAHQQQVRKIEVFSKRLSMQKLPKGAARIAQQVRNIEVFPKRLSVQKSPKGAARLAQQVRKIKVFPKILSVQKSSKGAAGIIGAQNRSLFQKTLRAKVA
jgi:hypothetical protein